MVRVKNYETVLLNAKKTVDFFSGYSVY